MIQRIKHVACFVVFGTDHDQTSQIVDIKAIIYFKVGKPSNVLLKIIVYFQLFI
tara:strand:- start:71 stop:232 length:162 start_codon:yes stop_codon:yes gene_type:complete